MGKNQHVVKTNNGWGVRGENNSKNTENFNTQKEAIEKAVEIAKNQKAEVLIHGRNGLIREKNTYTEDPYPPKG